MSRPADSTHKLIRRIIRVTFAMASKRDDNQRITACELCKREVAKLTVHHLIPRTRHKNKRNKKVFSREEVRQRLAMLCRPCHNNLHAVFTEKELEREYNTVAALAAHPDIARFSEWIGSRPDGTAVPVNRSTNQKRRRSRR